MRISNEHNDSKVSLLRQKAETILQEEQTDLSHKSPDQMRSMVHDLHVHQIELEMQNEELRAREAELEATRERMAELYDFAPVGYLTLDSSQEILQANLTCVSMLGVERSALLKQKFSQFVTRKDQDAFYHCVRRVFTERQIQSCELQLRPIGAPVFFARLEAILASEAGQDVCRMTLSNITDQKQAEERLRESERARVQYEGEEWKRLALEAGELGAWDQNLESQGNDVSCAGQTAKMLGLATNSRATWNELISSIHLEDRPEFLRQVELSTLPEGPRRADIIFRTMPRDGKVRWLRMVFRTSFTQTQNGFKATRRTGVLADITQLKEAEATLKERAKMLDDLVNERTARLQEAVAELEHLSYTLVHDLRAPLRAISGYTGLMLSQCARLEPAHKQFLERSNAAVTRMDALIVDALSYSQIGRQHVALEPVHSGELLRQLIETYPQFLEASQHITIQEPLPVVMANSALLTQCFSNLLGNALKFVPPGRPPVVRIFARSQGNRARIWFEDEGIGIDEPSQERIFQMFQRLHPEYEGTGIGLALVKKAIERMKGSVGLESTPGKGSRFWLELEKAK